MLGKIFGKNKGRFFERPGKKAGDEVLYAGDKTVAYTRFT